MNEKIKKLDDVSLVDAFLKSNGKIELTEDKESKAAKIIKKYGREKIIESLSKSQ